MLVKNESSGKDGDNVKLIAETVKSGLGSIFNNINKVPPFSILISPDYDQDANSTNIAERMEAKEKDILIRPSSNNGYTTISVKKEKKIINAPISNEFLQRMDELYKQHTYKPFKDKRPKNDFYILLFDAVKKCIEDNKLDPKGITQKLEEMVNEIVKKEKEAIQETIKMFTIAN